MASVIKKEARIWALLPPFYLSQVGWEQKMWLFCVSGKTFCTEMPCQTLRARTASYR